MQFLQVTKMLIISLINFALDGVVTIIQVTCNLLIEELEKKTLVFHSEAQALIIENRG